MDTPIVVAHPRFADLPDPCLNSCLIRAPGLVAERGGVKPQCPSSAAYRRAPIDAHPANEFAHRAKVSQQAPPVQSGWRMSFRRMTSCSISRSKVRSATIFFRRPLLSSSAFSRRISSGSSPPYRLFQLKQVAWLIPALRQISATDVPSSPYLWMNAFCPSEHLDACIVFSSSPSQGKLAEISSFERASSQRAEHTVTEQLSYKIKSTDNNQSKKCCFGDDKRDSTGSDLDHAPK